METSAPGSRSSSPTLSFLDPMATPFTIGEDFTEAQKRDAESRIDRFLASAANPDDILAEVVSDPAFTGVALFKLSDLPNFKVPGSNREMLYRLARESAALNFKPKSVEKNAWLHTFELNIFSLEEIKVMRAERKAFYAKAARKGQPFSAEEKAAYKRKIVGELRDFLRTLVGKFFIATARNPDC